MKNMAIFLFFISCLLSWGMGPTEDVKTLRIAGSAGYPPFNYTSNDEIIGFDVDVAREICSRLGYTLEYVSNPWDSIIDGLLAGDYDAICASMAVTQERLQRVDFSEPYYYSGAQLIVRKESKIESYESLNQSHRIGASEGTTFLDDIVNMGWEPYYFRDDTEAFNALLNSEIDGVITDRLVALDAILNIDSSSQLVLAGGVHRPESCAIAFPKGSELVTEFNRILADMRADGTLTILSKKWMQGQDITNIE